MPDTNRDAEHCSAVMQFVCSEHEFKFRPE